MGLCGLRQHKTERFARSVDQRRGRVTIARRRQDHLPGRVGHGEGDVASAELDPDAVGATRAQAKQMRGSSPTNIADIFYLFDDTVKQKRRNRSRHRRAGQSRVLDDRRTCTRTMFEQRLHNSSHCYLGNRAGFSLHRLFPPCLGYCQSVISSAPRDQLEHTRYSGGEARPWHRGGGGVSGRTYAWAGDATARSEVGHCG